MNGFPDATDLPRMRPYAIHNGTAHLSGQIALDAAGAPVEDQTRAVLARIDALLAEIGASRRDVLSATIWLADMADFKAVNRVWNAWVDPDRAPARSCVGAVLVHPAFAVEIAAIVALPGRPAEREP